MCEKMNIQLIKKMIDDKFISRRKHPDADLYILNYSPKCQIEWNWNEATMACRGMIVDEDYNIIERPFTKFFTMEQLCELQKEGQWNSITKFDYSTAFDGKFTVTEKVDGSLGVLYFLDGKPRIATRGSFESDQAIMANLMINRNAISHTFNYNIAYTYLFEIIYPENRIVVNYGEYRGLKLLAVIDKETGKDVDDEFDRCVNAGFDHVKLTYHPSFAELLKEQQDEGEGYVALFENGLRVKVKFEEYKRLHKILTGWTDKHIWWLLHQEHQTGKGVRDYLYRVPDEFYNSVMETVRQFNYRYVVILSHVANVINKELVKRTPPMDRKTLAIKYKDYDYKAVMFALIDGKEYKQTIWRMLKPKKEKK